MKTKEITEGWFDNLRGAIGMHPGQRQAAAERSQRMKTTMNKWMMRLSSLKRDPTIASDIAAINADLEKWADAWFKIDASAVPAPTAKSISDIASMEKYLYARTNEYDIKNTGPAPAPAPSGGSGAPSTDPFSVRLSPGVELVDDDPIIFKFNNNLYYLGNTPPNAGKWVQGDPTGGSRRNPERLLPQNWQDFFTKQHNKINPPAPPPPPPVPESASGADSKPRIERLPGETLAQAITRIQTNAPTLRNQVSVGGSPKVWRNPRTGVTSNSPGEQTPKVWRNLRTGATSNTLESDFNKLISEGGNEIPNAEPVNKEDVPAVVAHAKKILPPTFLENLQVDIGSAGFKEVPAGDIDLMIEASDVVDFFKTENDPKDPVSAAKKALKKYLIDKGYDSSITGRNVHVGIPYTQKSTGENKIAQVDYMAIHEAKIVAPWHQHGPRGMYGDSDFKGNELFILISSIAKHLNLKFDPFAAKLLSRDTGEVVGRTREQVAKILLGSGAKEQDMNSVKTMLKALENDPEREGKLAQAKQDAARGLIRLKESAPTDTTAWFRHLINNIS